MSLFETIRLYNGRFHHLPYHQSRMDRARKSLFKLNDFLKVAEWLSSKKFPDKGLFRCRITYDHDFRSVEFIPYTAKLVSSLKIVHDNSIEYPYKFTDRSAIENLFNQREGCDDVLIIKNGMVTDTSIANIVLKKGTQWYTPTSCLLPGTYRQYLIDKKKLSVVEIPATDLQRFTSFKLINGMLLWSGPEIEASRIVP